MFGLEWGRQPSSAFIAVGSSPPRLASASLSGLEEFTQSPCTFSLLIALPRGS